MDVAEARKARRGAWRRPGLAASQEDGERLVAKVRIFFAVLGMPLVALYYVHSSPQARPSLLMTAGIFVIWGIFSAVYLRIIGRGRYSSRMSYLSISVDVLAITGMQIAYIFTLPLNFLNSPITAFYFVIIGLAALRKNRKFVLFSGVGSAVAHLAVCAVSFPLFLPAGYAIVEVEGHALELTFLDEVVNALVIVLVAGAFSFVTKQLRESERHYRDLFEHVPDGILIVSKENRILDVNERLAAMAGLAPDELVGRPLDRVIAPDRRSSIPPGGAPAPRGDASGVLVRDGERVLPVRTVAMPVRYAGERCVEMSVRDVSEHVALERQLAQSQKMETLGRLAGGLAHDFNNILGGILGAASLAERNLGKLEASPTTSKLKTQVGVITECGERARDVVDRLMSFSRSRALETSPVSLKRILSDVATIAANTLGERVQIEISSAVDKAVVEGDLTSLTQALLNLCINGADAMPDGGFLSLRLREADLREVTASGVVDGVLETTWWCVEVADTGLGMEQDILERIFEPFFTTKPVGEGTGLGLPMVYNIAREHGGGINVESRPGEGAVFRIYLPARRGSAGTGDPRPATRTREPRVALLVDDDELVRDSVSAMLAELGFECLTAADGNEALRTLEGLEGGPTVLFLDVMMPGMAGDELLLRFRELQLDAKVIVITGFSDAERARRMSSLGIDGFLHKPFTLAELEAVLGEVLT
jgi:PAS domain S-box-containing protein